MHADMDRFVIPGVLDAWSIILKVGEGCSSYNFNAVLVRVQ